MVIFYNNCSQKYKAEIILMPYNQNRCENKGNIIRYLNYFLFHLQEAKHLLCASAAKKFLCLTI
ncbi:unnamed protein product [Paramecium octaurelia]|uniref:Uncharacterized protein n=1 Tax=Paramecium octaurelia TaxID=43137 RepID=A0A8S1YEU6_PAROT|nr:unnamed protein product [Paramecium octaurelia]